jgi:hypothetical protein
MSTDVLVEPRWSRAELRTLDEAEAKLDRRGKLGITVAILGVATAIPTLLVSRTGLVVSLLCTAIGVLIAVDSARKLRVLDDLRPGAEVNAATLGVATLVDAGDRPRTYGFVVLGGLVAFVLAAIAWAITG